jgi:hypothetical protein
MLKTESISTRLDPVLRFSSFVSFVVNLITGAGPSPKQASIQVTTGVRAVTVMDLLHTFVDGDYQRPDGIQQLNLITLNLGYLADNANSKLSITTLDADYHRELPLLNKVYSYDLDLNDYYSKCANSERDYLLLQTHSCDSLLLFPNQLPRLPMFCHTPYYNTTTNTSNGSRDSNFFFGQDPTRTRLHILDWRLNMTVLNQTVLIVNNTDYYTNITSIQRTRQIFPGSAYVYVPNNDAQITTDLHTYNWSYPSYSSHPLSDLCYSPVTPLPISICGGSGPGMCAKTIMDRLESKCGGGINAASTCTDVLNVFIQVRDTDGKESKDAWTWVFNIDDGSVPFLHFTQTLCCVSSYYTS